MRPRWRAWSVVAGGILCATGVWAEQGVEGARMASTVQEGMTVSMDYTLTVDGNVVDSSKGRSPLRYIQGQGQIIPGLERQLTGLKVGEAKQVTVQPKEGYGPVNPEAFVEIGKEQLPPDLTPQVGQILQGMSEGGRPFRAMIHKIGDKTVTLDLNHPLAGKTLQFDVTIVNIEVAAPAQPAQ